MYLQHDMPFLLICLLIHDNDKQVGCLSYFDVKNAQQGYKSKNIEISLGKM